MITVLFIVIILTMSCLLYNLINNWYIKPYEDLLQLNLVKKIEHETLIKSKNSCINELQKEIKTLEDKIKKLKAKATKKTTKKKILKVFPIDK